ncbi:MAG: amino acid decarboxylase, partial [Maribacter sp.]|nr:amino acid decarboxylase [Maribacter sp.]
MWISLQLLGLAPFKAALDEKILLCHYFYKEVQKLGFEVGPEPDLSIAIFRYVPKNRNANAFNQEIVDRIMQDGRIFLSSTTLEGVYWIRFAVLSFRTHLEQVELALRLLKKLV